MRKLREQIKGQIELLGESEIVGYQVNVMDLQVFAKKEINTDTLWDELTPKNQDRAIEMYSDDISNQAPWVVLFEQYAKGAEAVELSLEEYLKTISYNDYVELAYADYKDRELDNEVEAALSDLEIENIDDIEE